MNPSEHDLPSSQALAQKSLLLSRSSTLSLRSPKTALPVLNGALGTLFASSLLLTANVNAASNQDESAESPEAPQAEGEQAAKTEPASTSSPSPLGDDGILNAGDPAPSLGELNFLQGEAPASLALDEPGKVYLLELWATWCAPCIENMPHIEELHAEFADKGLEVIAVNVFDSADNAERFLESELGQSFSFAVADGGDPETGSFAKNWTTPGQIFSIPSTILVQEGTIVEITHPVEVTKEKIAALLAE